MNTLARGSKLTKHASKLSDADVDRIRAAVASGRTQKDVAVEYGVARSTVSQIVRNSHRPSTPSAEHERFKAENREVKRRARARITPEQRAERRREADRRWREEHRAERRAADRARNEAKRNRDVS